ncbi:hypothetical protein HHI36_011257 [Cryptolaemus montrouzieri]|uniref:Uncharacterized protein n=1 Tax=Cryptolaemus montrouzieri TaxID=559131 RepID=A0ABD2MLH9_9CUCU
MVHEGVNLAEENIREQAIPSENDDKIEFSNNDVEAYQSEIDQQAQSVAKGEENSHKNERKFSFERRMRGQEFKGYSGKGGKIEHGIRKKERRMLATCISNFCNKSSKRNCEKFSEQHRERIFAKFWKLNWAERKFRSVDLVTKECKKICSAGSKGTFNQKCDFYNLHKGWCKKQKCPSINQTSFPKIIKQENISIFRQRKVQCDLCVGFRQKSVSTEDYPKNMKVKEMTREEKEKDV